MAWWIKQREFEEMYPNVTLGYYEFLWSLNDFDRVAFQIEIDYQTACSFYGDYFIDYYNGEAHIFCISLN